MVRVDDENNAIKEDWLSGKGGKGGLPKTGESINIILPILGIILVAAGFVLRKRKTN